MTTCLCGGLRIFFNSTDIMLYRYDLMVYSEDWGSRFLRIAFRCFKQSGSLLCHYVYTTVPHSVLSTIHSYQNTFDVI